MATSNTRSPATIYPQVAETGPVPPVREPVPGALGASGSAGPGVPAFAAREANGTPGPALTTIAGQRNQPQFCPQCGQPVQRPAHCTCGHLQISHDINGKGARTACFHIDGPKGRRCPCKTYRQA
jgi:hypothetical protein